MSVREYCCWLMWSRASVCVCVCAHVPYVCCVYCVGWNCWWFVWSGVRRWAGEAKETQQCECYTHTTIACCTLLVQLVYKLCSHPCFSVPVRQSRAGQTPVQKERNECSFETCGLHVCTLSVNGESEELWLLGAEATAFQGEAHFSQARHAFIDNQRYRPIQT